MTPEEYEEVRKQYKKKFGKEAPHSIPREEEDNARFMRSAIQDNEPLEDPPEGYVT